MQWFKCLSPEHPLMSPFIDQFGMEGYGYACLLLSEAVNKGVFSISIETLCRWLGIRKPKALKLMPYCERLLTDYSRITKQSTRITEQSDRITPVISGSNPHGYRSLTEENRGEELCSSGSGCLDTTILPPDRDIPPPLPPPTVSAVQKSTFAPEIFTVRENNRTYTEEDWLCEHLSMVLRKHKHQFPAEMRLQGLLSLYPQHCKTYLDWFRYPIHKRLAAFAFMKTKSHADEEVVYATKVLRGGMSPGSEWDGIPKLLRLFETATRNGDYEVDLSNDKTGNDGTATSESPTMGTDYGPTGKYHAAGSGNRLDFLPPQPTASVSGPQP